ncbi:MAG: plastocyanin [Acidimicrobiia bacterium]
MIAVVRLVVAAASTIALVTLGRVAVALPVLAQVSEQVPTGDSVVTVHIRDNVFEPAGLEIAPGTTVRWVNEGRNRHDVTPDKGNAFRSGKLRPGQSFAHTFVEPGSFAYYCNIHGAPGEGQFADLAVGKQAAATPVAPVGGSDAPAPTFEASGRTIRVPADAATIQKAVDRTRPGDLVLVSPGVYRESVTVATDGIVLRGRDRNRTILDGGFTRDNGVKVVGADGVAVENITARNFTENGFFWTGVLGYRGSYLTAYRNGDYGIYAFDSVWGQFDHSYASGSPDAGFYVGQCNPCHALITDVVSEYNQLGYSGTNASGDLFIVRSSWSNNRSGIVPNSLNSELLPPQGHATIAGNRVIDNGSASAATGYEGFDVVFGVGVAVIGAVNDVVINNRIEGNERIGIGIAPTPGIGGSFYFSTGNQIRANTVSGSGTADLGIIPVEVASGNCFAGNTFGTSAPSDIERLLPCVGTSVGDPAAGALELGQFLDTSQNPDGRPYKKTPLPAKQRTMPKAASASASPAGAPRMPALEAIELPAAGSTPGR